MSEKTWDFIPEVKMIEEFTSLDLETSINEFLQGEWFKNNKCFLTDIKYTFEFIEGEYMFHALIIYDKREAGE